MANKVITLWKAFYDSKEPVEVYAASWLEARYRVGVLWNLKPSKWTDITVVLCEKQGEQVTHDTANL